jgi:hypothetical protein
MKCRHCQSNLNLPLIDLGSSPPSNAYLGPISLRCLEKWFPLKVLVCENCWLVQAEAYSSAAELFNDEYAYFSSFSTQWLDHAKAYVTTMVERFSLSHHSKVVEIACNDGYLLQFVKELKIPCLGVEPTSGTATAARSKGIEVIEEFFGVKSAKRLVDLGHQADLTAANNVLAHVPDINDFVGGFALLLKPQGVATFEFPHVLRLISENQFDTIYHEHFSYLSLIAVQSIFDSNGLTVFDVEEHPTHGGSLRVFAQRTDLGSHRINGKVADLVRTEIEAGIQNTAFYAGFQAQAEKVKNDFVSFLIDAKNQGMSVAAYGAAAKGNTLMNFAGIRPDLISFVVDKNPAKQGKFMPGSRIPILAPEVLQVRRPDYLVVLPWNLAAEVKKQNATLAAQGTKFVIAVPQLQILN